MACYSWWTEDGKLPLEIEIQIVPFGGKKPQLSRRRSPTTGPATDLAKKPVMDCATSHRDAGSTRPVQKQKASSIPTQSFPFVDVTRSFRDRDPDARKLVRSHVMKGSRRN